jgi:hypothetical protein
MGLEGDGWNFVEELKSFSLIEVKVNIEKGMRMKSQN